MPPEIETLQKHALSIRRRIIRLTGTKGVGHTGGSLSIVEILTALYFDAMLVDPVNPGWEERDRFVLSKGHATPGYYSALAERGFFPEADLLADYDEINSRFQGHPDMTKTPGVDMSTGSLGQGLSAAIGIALGAAARNLPIRAFVLLGDGEMQEGQVWEAIMYAGAHRVRNLVAIVDNNRLQLTAPTAAITDLSPLGAKVEPFGWRTRECDGHDLAALTDVLRWAREEAASGPVLVVAATVKGKGVSFIENRVEWHSKACNPAEMEAALRELAEE